MKNNRTRFADAMTQLNKAFEKAQEIESKKSSGTVAEYPVLLKNNTKFDETEPLTAQKLSNESKNKDNIAQDLEQAVEKLQARKEAKSLDFIEHENNNLEEEVQGAVLNNVDEKIKNLLEQLVQNTVDKRVLTFLEQQLGENKHFLQDNVLEQQELQYLTSTQNIQKHRNQVAKKLLQYSKVKLLFCVNLGQSKIKFIDLFSLKEGDIFALDTSSKKNLSFFINQKPVGSGKIVNSKENRGFQINSFYENL